MKISPRARQSVLYIVKIHLKVNINDSGKEDNTMADKLILYKLIVLYMLDKVDFPMTNSQISEFILEQGYTTYFKLQEALSDMADSDFIKVEVTHNRTLYHLTTEGARAISYLGNKISPAIKIDINTFLKEKKYDLKEEVGIKSDYRITENDEYVVRCLIVENGENIMDLRLIVPTEKEAQTITNNWIANYQQAYALLISKLL